MNFKQLEYLMAIYREGGVRKAAEKLFISQPALSQQLQRVEEELGIVIFERGTIPLRPTYAGRRYLEVVQKLLYEQEQAKIWIDEMKQLLHGKISIGISQSRSTQFLPWLLPEFKKQYPQIQIELHEEPMFKFHEMITSGEIDFALMTSEIFSRGLKFLPLVYERFFLAVPAGSSADEICRKSIEKEGAVKIQQLSREPFILLRHGGHLRKLSQELFVRNGITPNIVLETVNSELCLSMCSAGYGLTFVSEMGAHFSNVVPRPSYYSLEHEMEPWCLGIAYHPEHYQTQAIKAFIEFTQAKTAGFLNKADFP